MSDTELSAEDQTAQFLHHMTKLAEQLTQGGLVVAMQRDVLSWAQERYFEAASAEEMVMGRTWRAVGDPNSFVPCTQADWRKIQAALRALQTMLRAFDFQLPGGIPREPSTEVDRAGEAHDR